MTKQHILQAILACSGQTATGEAARVERGNTVPDVTDPSCRRAKNPVNTSVADSDLQIFGKPDPHQSENPDPDPQQSLMHDLNPHKKTNFRGFRGQKWSYEGSAWRLTMKPYRV
jgi:hypothetical protein